MDERNDASEELLPLWEEVLEQDHLDENADFFLEGGHSSLAVRLAQRISDATGHEVPLESVYDFPTPRQMADLLESLDAADQDGDGPDVVDPR